MTNLHSNCYEVVPNIVDSACGGIGRVPKSINARRALIAENKCFGAKAPDGKAFSPYRISASTAGGFSLFHSDGAAGKARSVKIACLADALTDQNGRKAATVGRGPFDEVLNLRI
jgi:hypothetical protein